MSVTLMRTKDGKKVPIKLSIWDAFKGAPVPKPRPHKCNTCGKLHRPVCKIEDELSKDNKGAKGDKSKESAAETKDGEKKSDSVFTPEEDAKIKEMKDGDPSCAWAKVAEALDNKHSKDACKHRYKELQDAEKEGDGKENKSDGDGKKGNDKDKKKAKKDNPSDDSPADKSMTKKEKKAAKKGVKEGDTQKAEEQKQDRAPAVTELAKPSEETKASSANADEKQKWVAAAAKHFDRTGQRITPEQARKMAEDAIGT